MVVLVKTVDKWPKYFGKDHIETPPPHRGVMGTPHLVVFLGFTCLHPEQDVDPFSCFYTARQRVVLEQVSKKSRFQEFF